jgi:hypothetical protein
MRRLSWQARLGLGLVALSAALYLVHYAVFRDAHHIFLYLIGDIAFLPVEVLIVTLIIHGVLTRREKRLMLNKLNMVIGVFFSEVGTMLLKDVSGLVAGFEGLRGELLVRADWTPRRFQAAALRLQGVDYRIEADPGKLAEMKRFLTGKRDFLLRLLENPNLLEHETFTDLLWAVFHLTEELASRADVYRLPESDYAHLSGDIKRAYGLLIYEWLAYMRHLREEYPYLLSLALRTSPFDLEARVEVG